MGFTGCICLIKEFTLFFGIEFVPSSGIIFSTLVPLTHKNMKTHVKLLNSLLVLLVITGIWSCENRLETGQGKGKAAFSLSIPEDTKSAMELLSDTAVVSYHILVSADDKEGNSVISDSLIAVYRFGASFISEDIELETGEYKLTKFMVINPSGAVIYAAPISGSPLAYLIKRPLPVFFQIIDEQTTTVVPEVLFVGDQTPGQFGYVNFGMQVIKPLHFHTICVFDPGNPLIMAPIQITTAKLTIVANDGWRYTFNLTASVNHLIIRGGSEYYTFILEKEGFQTQKLQFSGRQLAATTSENPLVLRIPWGTSQWQLLELQPGPDTGKDAMISNLDPDKNFGDHKYFETTFLSEPVLTVMRSNRSAIWFNLNALPKSALIQKVTLQLVFDLPVPFDTTFITDTPPSTGISWYGGVLQQIVEPWDEYRITWNNQPKTIEANQVYISPFIRSANFITVDVTRLFVPVNEVTAPNYGMLFKLWPTEKFPGFRFASGDYPDARMRPKLMIYYTLRTL